MLPWEWKGHVPWVIFTALKHTLRTVVKVSLIYISYQRKRLVISPILLLQRFIFFSTSITFQFKKFISHKISAWKLWSNGIIPWKFLDRRVWIRNLWQKLFVNETAPAPLDIQSCHFYFVPQIVPIVKCMLQNNQRKA